MQNHSDLQAFFASNRKRLSLTKPNSYEFYFCIHCKESALGKVINEEKENKMNDMQVSEALLKAILELINKCESLEELRESVKRIMN